MKTFLGYPRPNGSFGIRNWVLIIPAQREVNILAKKISQMVNGTKVILTTGEGGRPKNDRKTIARTFIGLGINSNIAGVLVIGLQKGYGYPELHEDILTEQIKTETGKPVRTLIVSDSGGFYSALGEGIRVARELVNEATNIRRVPCALSNLKIGIKCGMSDPTSGIVGNPVVGKVLDIIVAAGGMGFFSETTELIGAEEIVAKRGVNSEVEKAILRVVHVTEEKAKATGEDIRSINPIPANIAAGITTLEEKSIGAIAKSGSMAIEGVLNYAERPVKPGLYYMDSWMSSLSLPLGYAAAGVHLFIYQMGGGGMPAYSPMPAINSGIISPLMYVTGNRQTYRQNSDSMDFDSSAVMEGKQSINEMAERMLDRILEIASGSWTKMESWNYNDPTEILLQGPCF
ncbi:MAG: UxaA family hydrolase [Veillonellales bacterium]